MTATNQDSVERLTSKRESDIRHGLASGYFMGSEHAITQLLAELDAVRGERDVMEIERDDLRRQLTEARKDSARLVTDEMWERAIRTWNEWPDDVPLGIYWRQDRLNQSLKRALDAAMAKATP